METKKFTRLSLLLALSVVLNIIETMVPIFNGIIPGLKLGLANTVVLFVLYVFSFKDALYLTVLRVFLVGLLRTGIFSVAFFFSLGGSLFSVLVMALMVRLTKLSPIGVSVVGSIFHSLGQIMVATIILKNVSVMYYLPWLVILSIPTGIIVGLITKELIKNYKILDSIR